VEFERNFDANFFVNQMVGSDRLSAKTLGAGLAYRVQAYSRAHGRRR